MCLKDKKMLNRKILLRIEHVVTLVARMVRRWHAACLRKWFYFWTYAFLWRTRQEIILTNNNSDDSTDWSKILNASCATYKCVPGWNVMDRLDVASVENELVVVLLHFQSNTCQYRTVKNVKASHTCYRALGLELIPVYRQSARRSSTRR